MFWEIGVFAALLWCYNSFLESLLLILWGTIRSVVFREKLSVRYGPWAVVTGATDGIGKCYAEQLASKGLKVMLISRTESKLIKVAKEISQKYGVETRWIAVDFSDGPRIYDDLREKLASIEIGVLVNNVGFLPELSSFVQNTESDLLTLINLNILATTMLTRLVLPAMKSRRRGIVVNIASSSGYTPIPYMTAYSASKSFVISFSLALNHELRGSGVECQVVSPSVVRTNLSQHYNDAVPWYVLVLAPEQVAKFGVFTIGKTTHTCGHWLHCLQIIWWSFVPMSVALRIGGRLFVKDTNKK
ncbi:inactive hydroxysteroid dehydrogenase-like protein 1 [Aedes albopictus]|uniref:17 beta-hydroxysteroid dehydrogenase type 3 n=1 Tax=Aedes albopictus TaxID=7160 RepID=A0ABM1XVX7_AEDAL|nr:inactive hydroxysteroid dehydrogenase-like protein 1 [Aedes albopictus]